MNILITGAKGMVDTALVNNLKNIVAAQTLIQWGDFLVSHGCTDAPKSVGGRCVHKSSRYAWCAHEADRLSTIDAKSFYASVECVERHLDPLTTNLVVADNISRRTGFSGKENMQK